MASHARAKLDDNERKTRRVPDGETGHPRPRIYTAAPASLCWDDACLRHKACRLRSAPFLAPKGVRKYIGSALARDHITPASLSQRPQYCSCEQITSLYVSSTVRGDFVTADGMYGDHCPGAPSLPQDKGAETRTTLLQRAPCAYASSTSRIVNL